MRNYLNPMVLLSSIVNMFTIIYEHDRGWDKKKWVVFNKPRGFRFDSNTIEITHNYLYWKSIKKNTRQENKRMKE